MSIRYAIAESPYRWLLLAGIAFTAALVGTIFIFAFGWSHTIARIWLYAGLLATLGLLVQSFLEWKRSVEGELEQEDRAAREGA